MWIFCGGMPRSGSTVQFQLTAHVVEHGGRGRRVEWVKPEDWPSVRDKHAGETGWKVFKTHRCTPEMLAEFAAGNAKGVYVFRDVRDVIVSRMKRADKDFDRMWASSLDSILTSFDLWTALDAVLISRYEDMVSDMASEVGRIAEHLEIALSKDESEAIASEYTVDRQRERIREASEEGRIQRSGNSVFDPVSNLHVNHIRSGQTGEWHTELTSEQVALIEDRAGDWLVANGYPLSLPAWKRVGLRSLHAIARKRPGARAERSRKSPRQAVTQDD